MKTVTVTIEGGNVQDIDVPEGVQVLVYDYDNDDDKDDDGVPCSKTLWSHDTVPAAVEVTEIKK